MRLDQGAVGRREDDAARPERDGEDPGIHRADADGGGGLIAAAGHHGGPGRQPRDLRRRGGDRPRHVGPFVRPWEPGGVEAERVEHLVGPVAQREVEEQRAGTVGAVHGMVAGEVVPDEVLRQEHVRDPRPDLGLVAPDPEELGSGEPRERVVPGDRDQPLRAHDLADQVAFLGRPLVVPEDRGAEDVTGSIQHHGAVHLAGESHRRDLVAGDPGIRQRGTDRFDRRVPPQRRILFAPPRSRRRRRVPRGGRRADHAGAVQQERFRRRGRDVEPQGEGRGSGGHGADPANAVTSPRAAARP